MSKPSPWLCVILASTAALSSACYSKLVTPLQDIPKLTTLVEVMDNQATAADPQFSKIGAASYTEAEFADFAALGERIQATSLKAKDFAGKEQGFADFAMKLNGHAKELSAAAAAKDAAASSKALSDMKGTCKACHSAFR